MDALHTALREGMERGGGEEFAVVGYTAPASVMSSLEWVKVLQSGKGVRVQKGEMLMVAGERVTGLYWLRDGGSVRMEKKGAGKCFLCKELKCLCRGGLEMSV